MPEPVASVRLERPEDGIALLRLDRPRHLNALTDEMIAQIGRLLDTVAADQKIRVLILTGAGRGFCSGFDLSLAGAAPGQAPADRAGPVALSGAPAIPAPRR